MLYPGAQGSSQRPQFWGNTLTDNLRKRWSWAARSSTRLVLRESESFSNGENAHDEKLFDDLTEFVSEVEHLLYFDKSTRDCKLVPFKKIKRISKNTIASGTKYENRGLGQCAICYNYMNFSSCHLTQWYLWNWYHLQQTFVPFTLLTSKICNCQRYYTCSISLAICYKIKSNTKPQEFQLLCLSQNNTEWTEQSSVQVVVPLNDPAYGYSGAYLCEFPGPALLLAVAWSKSVVHIEVAGNKFGRVSHINTDFIYNRASAIARDGTILVAFSDFYCRIMSFSVLFDRMHSSQVDVKGWPSVLWLNKSACFRWKWFDYSARHDRQSTCACGRAPAARLGGREDRGLVCCWKRSCHPIGCKVPGLASLHNREKLNRSYLKSLYNRIDRATFIDAYFCKLRLFYNFQFFYSFLI